MKKLLFIATLLVLITSCSIKDYKYRVDTPDTYFYTDSYTVKDGCITFQEDCSDCSESGIQTMVCGSYTITTLK